MADPATPQFHYPPESEYTGFVQYRIDRLDSARITSGDKVYGVVRRAEVVKMKRGLAELATRGGDFSHVAADTPEGVPEEYRLKPKAAPAPAQAEPPLSALIRESLKGRTDLSAEAQQRLIELADAAESSDKISADASPEVKAGSSMLRATIRDEWQTLIATGDSGKTE